jgi:hypothetical protein
MIDRLSAITLWASGTADHRPNIPQQVKDEIQTVRRKSRC